MRSRPRPAVLLSALERLRRRWTTVDTTAKLRLLRAIARTRLERPAQVLRLHELLCFWRAYPDDPALLARVETMLSGFHRRSDLRRCAGALENSGLAGTTIRFRFFAPTARWLARRWPDRLRVDWNDFDAAARLETWLPFLVHEAEIPALDELDLPLRQWLARLRGPRAGEAAFVVLRLAALPMSPPARDAFYDELDPPLLLRPGPDTPSRTTAAAPARLRPRPAWFREGLSRERPDLESIRRMAPTRVRSLTARDGAALLDLARAAMVTRARDLDVFAHGDVRDVRLVDFEGGLQFACIGARPERRLLLEAVYGFLTLHNGVPIGYVLASALYGSSEIAYNVFDTFRGAEAGRVYGRVLAMSRHLFGVDTFTISPYQLGDGNAEAIESGAWWFYRKMGFTPRDPGAARIAGREQARLRRHPEHRTSPADLRRLARASLLLSLGTPRDDVLGVLELPQIGLHVARHLAERYGTDREAAGRASARAAARRLGVRSLSGWNADERRAWMRWAPLVELLPGLGRWSPRARRDLLAVIRAKGGRRESEFVRRFDAHPHLRRALRRLAETPVDA